MTNWISRMLSEADGTPSSKRVGYILVVVTLAGAILGFTAALLIKADTAQLVSIYNTTVGILAAAGTTGYVGGKAVDRGQS